MKQNTDCVFATTTRIRRAAGVLGLLALLSTSAVYAQPIADSRTEFSGTQGQDGWQYGYRNVTLDAKGLNYDAGADFIAFDATMFNGTLWDLDPNGAAPWTELGQEYTHPNTSGDEEHWAIRRWEATELSGATTLAVSWHVHKQNTSSGSGVTAALHLNGARLQASVIAGNDGAGVTRTNYLRVNPTDRIDLILSPVGIDGAVNDGADGSVTWMIIDIAADVDGDGLADAWEYLYFPGDLTKLASEADFDHDGLKDNVELQKSTDPTKADSDGDGLADGVETNTGAYVSPTNTGTDPSNPDMDRDGRSDGDEINVTPKTDPFDADSDDDTYLDGDEASSGHNPMDATENPETTAIANSLAQFSENQGQDGWFWGYRNLATDGGAPEYNPDTSFIAFSPEAWTGSQWDLNTEAAAPWTELGGNNTHPNGSNNGQEHWTIRRWSAESLTKTTPLALRWHTHKSNTGCGNGVTAALFINGQLKDQVIVAAADGAGVTHVFYANIAPGDDIDLVLSPRGADGTGADGCDGSVNQLLVDPVLPANPRQPDGSIFIPVGAGDTDADGLPDVWEKIYFPNDLSKLTATGDFDKDGLDDKGEYSRNTDPTKPDTDGDGLSDTVETGTSTYVSPADTGSNPNRPDTDGDTLTDSQEVNRQPPTNPNKVDTDSDGFSDDSEIAGGSNPVDPADNPLTFVIANSEKEFSGIQGANGWYNGYRAYDPAAGEVNYNPTQDFIPYPGGEGQGEWDGVIQTWNNGSWDLNTDAAAPWTYQAALSLHPNGTNSAPNDFEHWAIRRWVAVELTKTTPLALVWNMKKENANNEGVTGILFVNGQAADQKTIAGNDAKGETRRFYANLNKGDIVDLALTPEGLNGDRFDYSDGSQNWLWIDAKIPPNPVQPDGTPFVPAGQERIRVTAYKYDAAQGTFALTWSSVAGLTYAIETSADLKSWAKIKTGQASGGAQTSYTDTLAQPRPAFKFYRVLKE
jgi:hypothetical protein